MCAVYEDEPLKKRRDIVHRLIHYFHQYIFFITAQTTIRIPTNLAEWIRKEGLHGLRFSPGSAALKVDKEDPCHKFDLKI